MIIAAITSVSLKEDDNDDYSMFPEALIDWLMQAGIATAVLDDPGHENQSRGRGTSARGNLADVVLVLKKTKDFSLHQLGSEQMTVTDSRFGEITGTWSLELGGGYYGSWQH